jgi:hypothetical protein
MTLDEFVPRLGGVGLKATGWYGSSSLVLTTP